MIKRRNTYKISYQIIPDVYGRLQPPVHFHTFITGTSRYQLLMLLNDLNSNDIMSEVIKNVNTVSLLGFKRIVKTIIFDKYSFTFSIPNCYVCG